MISVTPCSKFCLYFVPLQASGPRAAATRPLLLHRHKTSRSSAHSYQVCPTWQPRQTETSLTLFLDGHFLRTIIISGTEGIHFEVFSLCSLQRPIQSVGPRFLIYFTSLAFSQHDIFCLHRFSSDILLPQPHPKFSSRLLHRPRFSSNVSIRI